MIYLGNIKTSIFKYFFSVTKGLGIIMKNANLIYRFAVYS